LLTVGVLPVVLVIRIVVLWTLIILSPLAYLLASFPQGQQYAKQWWDEFSKYVISGPVLAFFIWLALVVAGAGTSNVEVGATFAPGELDFDMGPLGDANNLSSFLVSTVLLLVGLMFTQKLGIAGSGAAGAVLGGLKRAGTAPGRWAKAGLRKGAGWAWKGAKGAAGRGAGAVSEFTYAKTGVALPFSERRRKAKEQRRKNISAMREAEGMARTAERMAGGRSFLASVIDPRAATKMSRWEMAKATLGGKEAQEKVQRAAGALSAAAASEMRSVDPLQAERLKKKTDQAIGERQAAGQMRERDDLEFKVRRGQAEISSLERGIQHIQKMRGQQGMSDNDLKKDIARERAEAQVAEEEKTLPMTDQERQQRFQDLYNENLSKIDIDKERKDIISFLTKDADKLEGKFILEKGKLEDALKVDASNLEKVKLRLENPSQARGDALSRRQTAQEKIDDLSKEKEGNQLELNKLIEMESRGLLTAAGRDKKFDLETRQKEIDVDINSSQQIVQNIDVELKAIEQAFGAEKAREAEKFFKKSYREQLDEAIKSAEGHSESNLAKKLAKMIQDGNKDMYDKYTKMWKEDGPVATLKAIAEEEKSKRVAAANT
jgi:hypothetical protein